MDFISVDLDAPSCAFGLAEDLKPFDSGWHEHNKHQLLYSAKGSMHLEAEGLQWLWNAAREANDALANHYFATLAALVGEWAQAALPFQLPTAQTTELARAMEYTLAHLEKPNIDAAARAAGMSPRTLARRFADETQTTWQQWTPTARMLRAMELLSIKGVRVTEAGLEVGYTSPAAFSHAFAAFAGETPTEFRR